VRKTAASPSKKKNDLVQCGVSALRVIPPVFPEKKRGFFPFSVAGWTARGSEVGYGFQKARLFPARLRFFSAFCARAVKPAAALEKAQKSAEKSTKKT
jgi:hypothetical protein